MFFLANTSGAQHWVVQRATAIILVILLVPFLLFSHNTCHFEVFDAMSIIILFSSIFGFFSAFFVSTILFIHLGEGVENIIQDYVHNEKTKRLCSIFLKCVQILSLKSIYLFLFLL